MKIKKKSIIITSVFLFVISTSSIMGGVFYAINAKNNNKVASSVLIEHDKYPFLPGNRDLEESHDASFDFNLREIKEPIIISEPELIPNPIKPEPQPEPEKEEPQPQPEPESEPETEKEEPQPEPQPEPEKEEPQPQPEPEPESEPETEKEEPEKQPEIKEETPPSSSKHDLEPKPTPKPIEEPEQPKPTPKPEPKPEKQPDPEPETYIPEKDKNNSKILGDNEAFVEIAGVAVRAKVEKPKPRTYFKKDFEAGITNPNPYTNVTVSKVLSIEVTDELREANLNLARRYLKDKTAPIHFREIWDNPKTELFDPAEFIRQNWEGYYKYVFHHFQKLFESKNLPNFLTEEGKQKLDELNKIENKYVRYSMYIKYLDHSKFNKVSKTVEEYLEKGYEIGGGIVLNENGEIDSLTFSPPAKNNSTTARMTRDNLERRVFGYSSWYWRDGDSITKGDYPGWTRTDSTAKFIQYGASKEDGIIVEKLTRNEPIKDQLNEGYVVTIDAANKKGYQKTLDFIKKTQADGIEITSYRIKNMGLNDSNQKFAEILAELPQKLPQLELFFESTNTSSLIALESKNIKELSLYTSGNSLLDAWSINPNALRKVEWINSTDYNVSSEYDPNLRIFTRITFDSLSFDAVDYDENAPTLEGKLKRINEGLRMAYYVRNNEPFFQGGFGPGLNPDHDEGGNSYPIGLDLSRVPNLKSLRGLVFRDVNKPQNKPRKLKRLVLFNNESVFTISASELNEAQLKDVLSTEVPQQPRTKILFSNGTTTNKIRIITPDGNLNSSGIQNLKMFKDYASVGSNVEIDMNNNALANAVRSAGFNPVPIENSEYEYN